MFSFWNVKMSYTIEQSTVEQQENPTSSLFLKMASKVDAASLCWTVFGAMFNHDMQCVVMSKTRQVNIKDLSPDTFEHLLFFLHFGKMKVLLTESLAQELLRRTLEWRVNQISAVVNQNWFLFGDYCLSQLSRLFNKIKERCIALYSNLEASSNVFCLPFGLLNMFSIKFCILKPHPNVCEVNF